MNYFERIIDIETGEEIMRPYTKEEIAQVEAEQKRITDELALKAKEESERSQAKSSILTKLGITEEEAKLLFS